MSKKSIWLLIVICPISERVLHILLLLEIWAHKLLPSYLISVILIL